MLVGYARVSTPEQSLDLQLDALRSAGCKRIFSDIASGAKSDRPGLTEALSYLRKGDTLVVWKLDRLGRSLQHLIEVIKNLGEIGIEFKSLQEALDTSTAGGKLAFHIFGAMTEFERELIRERTLAGLTAARARGRHGGRRNVLSNKQIEAGKILAKDKSRSIKDICNILNCSASTYYRYIHGEDR